MTEHDEDPDDLDHWPGVGPDAWRDAGEVDGAGYRFDASDATWEPASFARASTVYVNGEWIPVRGGRRPSAGGSLQVVLDPELGTFTIRVLPPRLSWRERARAAWKAWWA